MPSYPEEKHMTLGATNGSSSICLLRNSEPTNLYKNNIKAGEKFQFNFLHFLFLQGDFNLSPMFSCCHFGFSMAAFRMYLQEYYQHMEFIYLNSKFYFQLQIFFFTSYQRSWWWHILLYATTHKKPQYFSGYFHFPKYVYENLRHFKLWELL